MTRSTIGCGDAFCIGLLLPLEESPYYDFGKPLIKAAELARDDINQAGGNVRPHTPQQR